VKNVVNVCDVCVVLCGIAVRPDLGGVICGVSSASRLGGGPK